MTIAVLGTDKIAIASGVVTVYNYAPATGEYTDFNEEYLAVGVGLPALSTEVKPPAAKEGLVSIFTGTGWEQQEDNRGKIVYSTTDRSPATVDYIGPIQEGFVTETPATQYDIWNGEKWVTDKETLQAGAVAEASAYKQKLIDAALLSINLIQLKLQAGRKLTAAEAERLNAVLDYVDEVSATDISTAPDITWPKQP